MNAPSVGVAVVNWNSFAELQLCLAALAVVRGEIRRTVVIDNCSNNAPDDLPYPRPANTVYIRLDSNTGFARGNNLALPYLEDCDWIALVNPDAYVDPGWLEALLVAVTHYPDCVMFASCLIKANEPAVLDGIGDNLHMSGMAWRLGHGAPRAYSPIADKEVFAPCAAAALYRRDALVALGGFDEDFFCYFEDVDLAFRLRLAGHKCMLVGNAMVHHVGSATTGDQRSDFAVYYGHRNMVWCYVKNMPSILFWLLLPLHLMANAAAIIRFVLRGQAGTILRAKWDAIKGIPLMWKKHQMIQASRSASADEVWRVLDKSLLPRRR
ncbi:MAG: glycosyltransferase family 2 protein [Candidatus Accumulibacter sp.]|uniref:glycosyltransferase family 2 protein n=1 Tax=Accumulibacter sp. TaxID=2053492 RepID=UPI001ACC2E13|nr:glycosyltransferase family 2 protein [Accumulibacter sp.]MBN8436984.1 glycosyltransferase family 2 protein [Accumulibacter sp.]